MAQLTDITFPPGRMVWGSLYKANDKDQAGKPRMDRSGNPRATFDFGVAIPKGAEQHWASTPWGQKMWAAGHAGTQQAGQIQGFAWKVKNGDDAAVPAPGKPALKDRQGHAGHWIVAFSTSLPIRLARVENGAVLAYPDPEAIKPGDWVEVAATVQYNGQNDKPGIYVSPGAVCFRGHDPSGYISQGVDIASLGFGAAAVPAGVTMVPTGQALAPPPVAPAPVPVMPAPVAPAAVPVMPAPGFLAPTANVPVPVPPAAPVPTTPQLTAAALAQHPGSTYQSFIQGGWSDALLRQHGFIV